MTYSYEIIATGEIIEIEHPISQPALTTIERDGQQVNVRRVISGGTGFILKGDCWSRTNYERGIQNPEKEAREARQFINERKP